MRRQHLVLADLLNLVEQAEFRPDDRLGHAVPRRHEELDPLTEQLLAREPRQEDEVLVDVANDSAIVQDGNAVGHRLEQLVQAQQLVVQIAQLELAFHPDIAHRALR